VENIKIDGIYTINGCYNIYAMLVWLHRLLSRYSAQINTISMI